MKRKAEEITGEKPSMVKEMERKAEEITDEIDEDLQLDLYDRETTEKLKVSEVLVSGLNGLGAEIAKNLALAGVKSLTIHDKEVVEYWDLSSNFFISENDIGKNRAEACVRKLKELNNDVRVHALPESLSKEQLSNFQAVVFTDISLEKALEYNDYCHSHNPPIPFIKSDVRGLFGNVFCDFGPAFTVSDVNGEEPRMGIIASISNENPAIVSCVDDEQLEFQDGDLVIFSGLEGMTELNGMQRKVKHARPNSFTIEEDTTSFGVYKRGAIVTQVKEPKVLQFKPLRDCLRNPGDIILSDSAKIDRPRFLHLAFQALDRFRKESGHFPSAGSQLDAQLLIDIATNINNGNSEDCKLAEIDGKLLQYFASGSRAVLNPMAKVFGGIVGQEVVKACSGKLHPLFQFYYFDSVESLPVEPPKFEALETVESRYKAQISVFGFDFQRKLEEAQVFLVGAGALGCEFLKNFALMGVCCSSKGKLTVTGNGDMLEKSYLNQQSSTVAADAARTINPHLQCDALQKCVTRETEEVFKDEFWEGLDCVVSALDNVYDRLYVGSRCVYFRKPLLESGTLGTKCSTQMVIPHLTENYEASRELAEKQAPKVHSFPHNKYHCLTWACSEFDGLLQKTPREVNNFLSDPKEYASSMKKAGDAQARYQLESILDCLENQCISFEDCIKWARLKFEDYFSNRVKQLTHRLPKDLKTGTGIPFWSAPKRFPHPLQFDPTDSDHKQFVINASILRSYNYVIPLPGSVYVADVADQVAVPHFEPKNDAKIINDAAIIDDLIAKLEKCREKLPPGYRMSPIQFEKDVDTNCHMDFIVALANVRATNYGFPKFNKVEAKRIAGRILTSIATTTAMATGLVCLELYKVLDTAHKVEDYRNSFANLALPRFSICEPVPPKVTKHMDMNWTIWDRWHIHEDITLRGLLQWLEDKGLSADIVWCGIRPRYDSSRGAILVDTEEELLDIKVVTLAEKVAKVVIPPHRRHVNVVVACLNATGENVDVPIISVYFR